MRMISCALGVAACLYSASAEADASKAWAAAKDNLPANTQMIAVIDVAAIYKSPVYAKVLAAAKLDRGIGRALDTVQSACGWDPMSVVDGVVIAGDPKGKDAVVAYIQLTIDRAKASKCFESAITAFSKGKPVTVKQDGNYTVASNGKGRRDTAYFPWAAPNVVVVAMAADDRTKVDEWYGQKTFSKSKVANLIGKLDPKAVFSGALATTDGSAIDSWVPVSSAYGNLMAAGGKINGLMVATATDAKAAKGLADDFNKEMQRDLKKDRTPAAVKKIMSAISVTAAGTDLTIKGATTEKDLTAAIDEMIKKEKGDDDGPTDAEMAKALAKMGEFSAQMCACKAKACADKVNDAMTKWGTEMAKKANAKSSKPNPDQMKQAAEVMTRYTECMTKLMMAEPSKPTQP